LNHTGTPVLIVPFFVNLIFVLSAGVAFISCGSIHYPPTVIPLFAGVLTETEVQTLSIPTPADRAEAEIILS